MKTKTINYDSLVTFYSGEEFKHGEVVYTPTTGHDNMTNVAVNFNLVVLNDSVSNFTEELTTLMEKYAQ